MYSQWMRVQCSWDSRSTDWMEIEAAKPVPRNLINKVRLYFFEGRNTATVAVSAEEAKKAKRRGSDKIVKVRTPTDSEKAQLLKGVWLRTRKDGKSPEKSAYGKGRGEGPPRD